MENKIIFVNPLTSVYRVTKLSISNVSVIDVISWKIKPHLIVYKNTDFCAYLTESFLTPELIPQQSTLSVFCF